MNKEKEIVCGADIHRDFLVATMISRDGLKLQEQFDMNEDGLLEFISWILDHRCQRIAVESTGNYCILSSAFWKAMLNLSWPMLSRSGILKARKQIGLIRNESLFIASIILSNLLVFIRRTIEN